MKSEGWITYTNWTGKSADLTRIPVADDVERTIGVQVKSTIRNDQFTFHSPPSTYKDMIVIMFDYPRRIFELLSNKCFKWKLISKLTELNDNATNITELKEFKEVLKKIDVFVIPHDSINKLNLEILPIHAKWFE
jgi:tRNA nucleotidyltransferase/poly(A) polymerase